MLEKIYPFTFALPQLPEFHDLVEYSNAALVIYDAYGNCDSQAAWGQVKPQIRVPPGSPDTISDTTGGRLDSPPKPVLQLHITSRDSSPVVTLCPAHIPTGHRCPWEGRPDSWICSSWAQGSCQGPWVVWKNDLETKASRKEGIYLQRCCVEVIIQMDWLIK